jgi:glycosyltransferase involved in cell wall biosynthesis
MIDSAQPDYDNTPASPRRANRLYVPADPGSCPMITIVTPYFNTGVVFEDTARSVMRQSFQQWEWLIINDGSSDPASIAQLEPYRTHDPRIHVIDHDHNRGLSAARNTGFRQASTSYVALLDSDDMLEPTALEQWVWSLESHPEYSFVKGYTVGFGAQNYLWNKGFHNSTDFLHDNQVDATSLIRRSVWEAARGFDESNRGGLEDWDFWLRCADRGFWGGTVPEYHDWYRRRATHSDRWGNWDSAGGMQAFRLELRQRYPRLWQQGFPRVELAWHYPNASISDTLPFDNRLAAGQRRLLILLPYLTVGGADKFDLDLVEQLVRRGWEITVATTLDADHSWLPRLSGFTPDVFALHRFLRLVDYPRFLRYLLQSRQIDTVLISNSELSYLLLPYLRSHAPHAAFLDYCHMEEEQWKSGGYPAMAVEHQPMLDLNLVASNHLRGWMLKRGADAKRIAVCYINTDPDRWTPDPELRQTTRQEFGLADNTPLLLYSARLVEQKRPRILAMVLQRLQAQGVSFVALVAGDGPDSKWLQSFVRDEGLTATIRLMGSVQPERMRSLLAAADIFFLPSQWEGIALSLFEAMAAGLPVVAADVGGQRELVTPECGVLVKRGNTQAEVDQYAAVLAELLQDAPRRQTMGVAARRRIQEHFHLEQMGANIQACLQRAQAFARAQPRPTPDLALGRMCAAQAVEYIRLSQLADQLWAERHGLVPAAPSRSWRRETYQSLYRWHEPFYRWYSQRGWNWLSPVRKAVKRVLLSQVSQAHK